MVSRPTRAGSQEDRSFEDRLRQAARESGRPLSDAEATLLLGHFTLLLKWSRRMNLTGLRDEGAILRRHFLEPIAAADLLGETGRLVDLGSGNGFPAIPLKVLHPGIDLILVESSEKKSAFLWAVLRELRLRGSRVETRRIGSLKDLADLLPCRYLTFRAIRARELLGEKGVQILEKEGRALLFVAPEEAEAIRARPLPGLRLVSTRPLPSGPRSILAILEPA